MDRPSRSSGDFEETFKPTREALRSSARAEQEIRALQDSFALVVRHGSDLIMRCEGGGKVLDVSPSCQKLLGVTPDRLTGRYLAELVNKEERDALQKYFQDVLQGETGRAGVVIHMALGEPNPPELLLHCCAVPHPQTRVLELVIIGRIVPPADTSPNLHDELALSLAHELNQPLTALALTARACSNLTRDKAINADELTVAIEQIAVQAERAGELVRRMRQLVVRAAPHWSYVGVEELIRSALKPLEADIAAQGVVVELHVSPGMPKIRVDRIQIEQVLINLARNAVEAMTVPGLEQRRLIIAASQADPELVIVVADTGPGLAPEIKDRLFEPYQTTKTHGMGLGLAVSRAILQAHAGRLWTEPAHGPGAAFCLALPMVTGSHEQKI